MPRDVYGAYVSDADCEKAAENGICKETLSSRIRNGWKIKDAIAVPVMERKSEEYIRYKNLAISKGIKADTFKSRMRLGWTLEDAANAPLVSREECAIRSHKARKRVIPESSVKEAEKNGIRYGTLGARLRSGVPMSEAISIPPGSLEHPWKKSNNAIFAKRNRHMMEI